MGNLLKLSKLQTTQRARTLAVCKSSSGEWYLAIHPVAHFFWGGLHKCTRSCHQPPLGQTALFGWKTLSNDHWPVKW